MLHGFLIAVHSSFSNGEQIKHWTGDGSMDNVLEDLNLASLNSQQDTMSNEVGGEDYNQSCPPMVYIMALVAGACPHTHIPHMCLKLLTLPLLSNVSRLFFFNLPPSVCLYHSFFFLTLCLLVGIEPRTSSMLGKHSITELHF